MEGFLRYRFGGLIFGGGLYTEGLIFGILWYLPKKILTKAPSWEGGEGARIHNDS